MVTIMVVVIAPIYAASEICAHLYVFFISDKNHV